MPELTPIPSPGVPLFYGTIGDPLVVLVHDWFGRLPSLEPFARALARDGFRVAVPDLYHGWCTTDEGSAEQLMASLEVALALDSIEEIIDTARAEDSARIGVLGFSMGGWLALLHAQGGSADAVVAYYATLGLNEDGIVPNPVLLQFAEDDDWDAGADPEAFIDRLTDHGTPVEQFTYIATRHSFANASIPTRFDANASALAFARSSAFLEKHLQD